MIAVLSKSRACRGAALAAALWICGASGVVAAEPAPAIRQLTGKHLTLFTDVPSSAEVDVLPEVFDKAFPAWCAYFGVDPKRHADWRVTGCLMKAKERFAANGLLPAGLPQFPNGYFSGDRLWLFDQSSDYYRRHLLLHEGTHAFMSMVLGGDGGQPWYREGMAELLGTHHWRDGRIELAYFPRKRSEVPRLGRIKIIQDGYAEGHAMTLPKILAYDNRAHLQNEPYGWCWGAAAFLDGHPKYQERFRKLQKSLDDDPRFNERFMKLFADDWPQLCEEWQVFAANVEYNYDFQKMAIDFVPGQPLPPRGAKVAVAADRGWQSSKLRLEAGRTYRLKAAGRYQVAAKPRPWVCEPGGVTARYYHGQPLGILLAAVRPDEVDPQAASPLVKPTTVGLEAALSPEQSGTLYLRINDSAGKLADNAGTLTVEVVLVKK